MLTIIIVSSKHTLYQVNSIFIVLLLSYIVNTHITHMTISTSAYMCVYIYIYIYLYTYLYVRMYVCVCI